MLYTSTEELYRHYVGSGQKICTDTRKIEKGALFFALKGDNFNANAFAARALEQGCSYAIVDEEQYVTGQHTLLVKDVLKALQELANHYRKTLKIPVLAITGSNAKTTNKELINAVLSKKYKTHATFGNLNNHIGVPLTLLSIPVDCEFAIVEMGANHQGEIEALCKIADPDFGLVTNIGKAHLEGFGGIEGVKKGKSELYRYLNTKDAKSFVNGDDPVLSMLAFDNDKITYGCKKLYDVIGLDCTKLQTVSFKYTTRYGNKDFKTQPLINTRMVGAYNFINCLAAACVGNYFKVEDKLIQEALENYLPEMNRSQLVHTNKNTIILDAYNANPDSMKAAIENFATFSAPKKMLLLGDMFELGEYSAEEHQRVVDLLEQKRFAQVILVGNEFSKIRNNDFRIFKTTQECREYLEKEDIADTTVLIKGSRGMKMESLKEVL